MKKLNNKGVALIVASLVLFVLVTLSAGFALAMITELNNARRYRDSAAAFWLAEGEINRFIKNPTMLDEKDSQTIPYGKDTVTITRDDSHINRRIITATATVGGSQRKIQIEYPAHAPEAFNTTMSADGNIVIEGNKASVLVNGKIRLSGKIINKAKHSNLLFFEDKMEGVNPDLASLSYPDANNNGVTDEFEDFVQINRRILASYPGNEVLYIQGNGTHTIVPNPSLYTKKIIYIEGREGMGNVIIPFNGIWGDDQNVTIITTGIVTYNLSGPWKNNSQLNIIAWSGYRETGILSGRHRGIIHTHGKAEFDEIYDTSITEGTIVANGGITLGEVWSPKTFNYADTRTDGMTPPGFEGLIATGSFGFETKPIFWKEI